MFCFLKFREYMEKRKKENHLLNTNGTLSNIVVIMKNTDLILLFILIF